MAKQIRPAELVDAMAAKVGQGDDSNVSLETREHVEELFRQAKYASSSSSEEVNEGDDSLVVDGKRYKIIPVDPAKQKEEAEIVADMWDYTFSRPPYHVRMQMQQERLKKEQEEMQMKLSAISITEQQDATQDQGVQSLGSSEEEA